MSASLRNREAPPIEKRPLRGGVVIFDNPRDMTTGWACAYGESPFRIRAPMDLPNNVIWIAAADWAEFSYRPTRLHHLRRGDYLRTSLQQMSADLGLRLAGEYAMKSSELLAKIVHRVMTIAGQVYGTDDDPLVPREDTIAEDIRARLPGAPSPVSYMRWPLESAYQNYSSVDIPAPYEPDMVTMSLRMNRLEHAHRMMGVDIPDEGWTHIPDASTVPGIDFWLDPDHPSLVEVLIEGDDYERLALVAFGSQPGKRRGLRTWVSQLELGWLSSMVRVQIEKGYIAHARRKLPPTVALPPILSVDPLYSLSYATGIVAECHWQAIAAPKYQRSKKAHEHSVWGTWIRALDRKLSFELAKRAFDAGYRVVGYGNGSAVIRASRPQLPKLMDDVMEWGVAYPGFQSLFQEHGIDPHSLEVLA